MTNPKKIKFEEERSTTIEEVVSACKNGDLWFLENLKSEGYTFEHPTLLFSAGCDSGSIRVVSFLREIFGDTELKELSPSPLLIAVEKCHLDLAKFLIGEKIDENQDALSVAAENGNCEMAKFLIDCGFDVNQGFPDPPLPIAVVWKYAELVKLLLTSGADPNFADDEGETLLFYAVRGGDFEIMKLLIEFGADINKRGIGGYGIFHLVENVEQAEFFFEAGGNPDVIDEDQYSPLHTAIHRGNLEMAKFFISKGLCSRYKNEDHESALSIVMENVRDDKASWITTFTMLLDLKNDKNQLSYLWESVIHEKDVFAEILLKNKVPFPKGYDCGWVKPIFAKVFEFEAGNVLLCAREDPGSPFFKDVFPLDMLKEVYFSSKKASLEHAWSLFFV